ncbi:MAG: hypothetical protein FJX39_07135 [Alphaproteobacteria bacterium]|nr:hypothetical protein [Alphaproteobacteria bacterium]
MSFLNTLTFTNALQVKPSPLQRKRASLLRNLKDQLALLDNPNLAKTRFKRVEAEGCKEVVELRIPVRPWWRETIDGKLTFFLKSGLKRIEFEKGQTAILVPNKEALPGLINGLIKAVEQGELDNLIVDKTEVKPIQRKKVA